MKINIQDAISDIPKNKLPNGYSVESKKEARYLHINDQAVSRQKVEGVTIDARESRDLDDGIWAERTNDGGYMVQVSIADVSEAVKPFSTIDQEAIKKTTSIYLSTHNIHMIPPLLSCNRLSLIDKQDRLTLTVQIDFDSEMNITNSEVYESTFYNKNRFDYEDFSKQITYMDSEYYKNLDLFYEVGKKLRKKRQNKGFIDFEESDRKIGIIDKKHIASMIIEEFMIAANIEASKFTIKANIDGIFRNHMPQYKNMPLTDLKDSEMQRAFYAAEMLYHKGLEEGYYTHFTSPIRRLADLILHRQIKAHLRDDEPVYDDNDISILSNHINIQRSVLEILGKNHNYNAKLINRHRKIKKRFERVEKREGVMKVYHLKQDIRKVAKTGMRLPDIVRNEIIRQIKEGQDEESWSWSLGVFLVSEEKEIIQALKEKVLSYPMNKSKRFLAIIGQTIIERKRERVVSMKESERKVKGEIEYSLEINYLGQTIISSSERIYEDKLTSRKGFIRRNILEEVFDYFLEN